VAWELGPHGSTKQVFDLAVTSVRAQHVAHTVFVVRKEAVADRTVGREPKSVAGATERLGNAGNQSNLANPISESESFGRSWTVQVADWL
jgi:hypothetical protein